MSPTARRCEVCGEDWAVASSPKCIKHQPVGSRIEVSCRWPKCPAPRVPGTNFCWDHQQFIPKPKPRPSPSKGKAEQSPSQPRSEWSDKPGGGKADTAK